MAQTDVRGGIARLFTAPGTKAYDGLKWVKRDSLIMNPGTGKVVFEQNGVEFTPDWSVNAINIVAQKYFAGTPGSKEREGSIKQLIDRVADTVTRQGMQEGYFTSDEEAETFREELKYICATQRAAFNSPVWFNIGWHDRAQQASACFILGVEDTMESILNWYTEEGLIFKGGSGSGVNISNLRSSTETLGSSGGKSSGPVSFMRGADSVAGTIKSGGKTRRAAKMVILNVDHPDIEEFIWCKAIEEKKGHALKAAGFDMSLDGKDIFSIQYQNANNSVRVTDEFMIAVENDESWDLKAVKTGKTVKTVRARDIYRQFAQAAWECADPGMQFDTTINKWHTSPNAGRINGSNPCSEYMHLDNSACNLASINLLKYLDEKTNRFDVEAFKHTVQVVFTAQEILVGYSSYPTESIAKNARAYRELGMGYANLGAMLMAQGLAYDSDAGRAQAGAITALMTGHAYATSARIANKVGPFAGYHKDKDAMQNVLKMHRTEVSKINAAYVAEDLLSAAAEVWDDAVELCSKYGIRNSQATVLAPTGTIGLMMDCDTTGIEPDLGLTKVKKLVGGGTMFIVNQTVPRALRMLGHSDKEVDEIVAYIDTEKTILGAPYLDKKNYDVFACSMGDNAIHYMGHVKMMAAAQPFLSGAISKTVNMPEEATVEGIEQLHIEAWKMGIKAIAIYRDNCKVAQPLSMAKKAGSEVSPVAQAAVSVTESFVAKGAVKRELPRRRLSRTYEFRIADLKGFFTVGEYDDGTPGELFINVSKQGSTLSGLMDSFAISVSHGLSYGVPLKSYVKTLMSTSFAPAGVTDDKDIRTATSITDYIFRRLALDYLSFDDRLELGLANFEDMPSEQATLLVDIPEVKVPLMQQTVETSVVDKSTEIAKVTSPKSDPNAPLCYSCGNRTQRSGSCYVCTACGSTSGCS
jgi:ribonucleoside-diphosphate reductase alpha chain